MTQFDYEVITAEKLEGVTKEAAQAALESRYPEHLVIVEDHGKEFVATLARKNKVGKTVVAADDDALDLLDDEPVGEEIPGPKDEGKDDEPKTPKEPKEPKEPKGLEDSLKDDKDGEGEGDDNPVSQILDALKSLEKWLPKVKEQLGGLDTLDTPELGPEGLDGPPGLPHGGPKPPGAGPEGLGPLGDDVGPTPGKPPSVPRKPPVPSGGAPLPPGAGVPKGAPSVFGNVKKNKVVVRQKENVDGSIVTLAQATEEIENHPKYAGYEIVNIKPDGDTYKAHLRYREG